MVVVVAGELDADTAGRLREAVDELVIDRASVVLDLAGVSFIDSSGLLVLLHALDRAAQCDAELSVRSPSASVLRLFELTGQTDRILPVEP